MQHVVQCCCVATGYDDEEIGSEDGDGWEDDMEDSAEGAGSGDANSQLANRRRGKGTGNPGKPGKKLRLADLQSQFGVGLKVSISVNTCCRLCCLPWGRQHLGAKHRQAVDKLCCMQYYGRSRHMLRRQLS